MQAAGLKIRYVGMWRVGGLFSAATPMQAAVLGVGAAGPVEVSETVAFPTCTHAASETVPFTPVCPSTRPRADCGSIMGSSSHASRASRARCPRPFIHCPLSLPYPRPFLHCPLSLPCPRPSAVFSLPYPRPFIHCPPSLPYPQPSAVLALPYPRPRASTRTPTSTRANRRPGLISQATQGTGLSARSAVSAQRPSTCLCLIVALRQCWLLAFSAFRSLTTAHCDRCPQPKRWHAGRLDGVDHLFGCGRVRSQTQMGLGRRGRLASC